MTAPTRAPDSRNGGGGFPQLSLSMIVRDEQHFLPGCLESVREVADEIVIVDTGSTDGTLALARAAGARVCQIPWTGDFSEARNTALEQCTGDWVLYLDADERLEKGQQDLVRSLVANESAGAFNVLVRSTLSLEGGKATQLMPYPRLFRRMPGVRFEGSVHEQIAPSILRTGKKILPSALAIEHLGYDQGFGVLKAKIQRNLAPLLARIEANPSDWYAHLHVARSLLLVQDFPAVVHHARAALRGLGVPRTLVATLHNLLAEVMIRTRRWGEAIEHCHKSLALLPGQAGARWFLAGGYISSRNTRAAIPVLEELAAILAAHESSLDDYADDIVLPLHGVWDLLGRCYADVGLQEKAVDALFRAVRANPSAAESLGRLLELHEKLRQPALAVLHCEELVKLMPADARPALYLALSWKRRGGLRQALSVLDRLLAVEPADRTALSWKAVWLLEQHDLVAVERILEQAGRLEVGTDELLRCAFDLAMQQGRYDEALKRLKPLEHLFPAEEYRALQQKVAALAPPPG